LKYEKAKLVVMGCAVVVAHILVSDKKLEAVLGPMGSITVVVVVVVMVIIVTHKLILTDRPFPIFMS
jgi:hypothetical protein